MFSTRLTLQTLSILTPLCIALSVATAQKSEPSTLRALPVQETITLDGRLTEAVWQSAERISNFTQRELREGEPATERTEVAVLFTSEALYVAVWAYDSEPEKIAANLMQRDFDYPSEDHFKIIIDPYNAARDGYVFIVNPNAARADAFVADNGNKFNYAWDGVWDAAATVNDLGWFVEIEIPFTAMRAPSAEEQTWGINFERYISRKLEQGLWQGWSRNANIFHVRNAGTLTGIREIQSGEYVDLRPYALGGTERARGGDHKTVVDAGLDANYLLTPTVRLSVTVNPDFAQVEADRVQLNLTRFSLYYPEKRKFFLEGQEFFDFKMGFDNEPFYSRRIGLADDGSEVPIIAGARVLGKTGGSTIGALVMQTAEAGGQASANFAAVRYKEDIFDESYAGFLGITRIENGEINVTYAGDFLYSISDLFGDKNFKLGALVAQTYSSDATIKNGGAQRLYLAYPNDLIDYYIVGSRVANEFNPEVGFLRRTNFRTYYTRLDLFPRPEFIPWISKINVRPLEIDYYENDVTGQLENMVTVWRPFGLYFTSGEYLKFDITRTATLFPEPHTLAQNIVINPATYWYTQYILSFNTHSGRDVYGAIELTGGDFIDGPVEAAGTSLTWRASKYLALSADYEHRRIVVHGVHAAYNNAGSRVSFAFSPDLFGSLYGQWSNERGEALLNFRINWIPNPGSDVYLVVNQRWSKSGGVLLLNDTAVLSKIVWRFEV